MKVDIFLDAGQTYFLGHQPIHVQFFKPDHQPQFKESPIYSESEYIIIAKDLVERYALLELGFRFNPTDAGLILWTADSLRYVNS